MDFDTPFARPISWPGNHRAAMIILIHVDAPNVTDDAQSFATGLDYTATGLQRLLKAFADLDVPVSTAWTTRALSTYPQLARGAQDQGHELAISLVGDPTSETDGNLLSRISDIPGDGVVEGLPGGWFPHPAVSSSPSLASASWVISGLSGDVPVRTLGTGENRQATLIPVSPYWIDLAWLDPQRPLPPSSLLEAWSFGLASVRTEGGLMTVVIHPHVSGRPGFAEVIVQFVDEAIASGDVWIASAVQVSEWWRKQCEQIHE